MLYVYKVTNIETGECVEGSIGEVAEQIGARTVNLKHAFYNGKLAYKKYEVTRIASESNKGFECVCVICGKPFTGYRPGAKCCSEECGKINKRNLYDEWVNRKREEESGKQCKQKKKAVIKKKSVCKGCKYRINKCQFHIFNDTCGYMDITGHSRIVIEMQHGGVKADSCVCYEKGTYKPAGKQPLRIKKVR